MDASGAPLVRVRAVATPRRNLSSGVVAARPGDGAPVLLPATAAVVFAGASDGPVDLEILDDLLHRTFPEVDANERRVTLRELVNTLIAEGLLARS